MFIESFLTEVKYWKQSKYTLTVELINKLWYGYTYNENKVKTKLEHKGKSQH